MSRTIVAGLGPCRGWDHIDLTGIEVRARHGVFDFEKEQSQPFVVDLRLWLDTTRAAATDDLGDSLDYVTVGEVVVAVVRDRCYDLIETLADAVAGEVLALPGPHRAVRVTVHKPRAAKPARASGVSVTVTRRVADEEAAT